MIVFGCEDTKKKKNSPIHTGDMHRGYVGGIYRGYMGDI
jgi:hypothetical protein